MTHQSSESGVFSRQVSRFGLWCAVLCIVTAVIAALLPLDVPDGYSAAHTERLQWLTENRDAFVAAWVNQIVAMVSLSGLFLALCWRGRSNDPLRALLATGAVAMATMAFVIPKFIAIWTIPLLVNAAATVGAGADMAAVLLPLLNVSIPFSLYTSFDYLGFWLYALFAVLMMKPLYDGDGASKLVAILVGLFGIGFHVAFACLLLGVIQAPDIEISFGLSFIPLLLLILILAVTFSRDLKHAPNNLSSEG
ncbi:MAG: hypothetical protein HOJ46_11500 [Halieaceae bacterium]|jgi:hypothetical protein|nr:hypothetical protein [Halieaceae bacterium]